MRVHEQEGEGDGSDGGTSGGDASLSSEQMLEMSVSLTLTGEPGLPTAAHT